MSHTGWIRFTVLLLVVWTKTNERNMCSQLDLVFFQRLCLHNFIQCLTLYWLKYEFSDVWHHCHGYKNVSLGHAVQTEHKARERERGRELKELHSCVHVQHSGRVQWRASLNECGAQSRKRRTNYLNCVDLILNVMVFNTFRFFRPICKCLHHHDTQPASPVCSWQGFTVLQRSWLLLTGRICLAVTLVEPRPPEGTVKLQD